MKKFLFICSIFLATQTFADGNAVEKGSKNICEPGSEGSKGKRGERGDRGIRGPKGENGQKGQRGPRGERGERGRPGTSNGTIIPFSSGNAFTLTGLGEGEFQALIGFGTYGELSNSGLDNIIPDSYSSAFTLPQYGRITNLAASFITTSDEQETFGSTVVVHAEIYLAFGLTNVYIAQGGVDLEPSLIGTVPGNTILQGTIEFDSPIEFSALDRLIVVYSLTSTQFAAGVLTGVANAGVTIE